MQFTFIANACGIFTLSKNTKILMDPWLNDGVFEGSWCHYPPLKTKHSDLQDIDAIYLSHIHPDHYDERYFNYPRNIPIYILKSKYNFLFKNLLQKGYTNVREIESGITVRFKEAKITIFSPFSSNVFHSTGIDNFIDSAIVIQDENGTSAFNANDNKPDKESCKFLRDKFGNFDLAMINYNAAGPYPSCFTNLSEEEKINAHNEVLHRNIKHLIECCNILKPKKILPFAGAYVIGGKEYKKNNYLGTTTWDYCALEIQKNSPHSVLTLRESDTYNLLTGKSNKPYIPINVVDQKEYISKILSNIKYPYEHDNPVDEVDLCEKVTKAIISLKDRTIRYGIKVKSKVKVYAGNNCWIINQGDPEFGVNLDFYLDERLLNRILRRQSHWNNAEIGCHINIDRRPNKYEFDAHIMMQFFHL